MTIKTVSAFAAVAALAACSAPATHSMMPLPFGRQGGATLFASASTPIKHVVFIIQENRSFNNLFMGSPGATTQNYGYDKRGRKIVLHPQGLATFWDISHLAKSFFAACDGQGKLPGTQCKMDGWNGERERTDPRGRTAAPSPSRV